MKAKAIFLQITVVLGSASLGFMLGKINPSQQEPHSQHEPKENLNVNSKKPNQDFSKRKPTESEIITAIVAKSNVAPTEAADKLYDTMKIKSLQGQLQISQQALNKYRNSAHNKMREALLLISRGKPELSPEGEIRKKADLIGIPFDKYKEIYSLWDLVYDPRYKNKAVEELAKFDAGHLLPFLTEELETFYYKNQTIPGPFPELEILFKTIKSPNAKEALLNMVAGKHPSPTHLLALSFLKEYPRDERASLILL